MTEAGDELDYGDQPMDLQRGGREGAQVPTGSDDPERPLVGESTDPDVQQLLARRQDATLNEDEAMVAGIDARLAELGYQRQPTSDKEASDG